mgnify:CR=1 FL=1
MDKEEPKEKPLVFCPLCGKNQKDDLISTPTVEMEGQTLMFDMCPKCNVVTHNLFRGIEAAIKQRVSDRSRLFDPSGRRLM